jgi:FlaA1/EpsC-like NDP-sugar epimerase
MENNVLGLLGRTKELFNADLNVHEGMMRSRIADAKFLVIGGAGSIGGAVVREIFERSPLALHVVDISENSLVELVRDLRSSVGHIDGDFRTFAVDCGSDIFERLVERNGPYDYVLNFSALKHVRSERDPFTLMRLIEVNILNTIRSHQIAKEHGAGKYFCVSTDKATAPVNMMGASKRIMEMFLSVIGTNLPVSTARFANVAFSEGSLLQGFLTRLEKRQPLSAPRDVLRYFVSKREAGRLCLMSIMLGENGDIFFPHVKEELTLISFTDIATRLLKSRGLKPVICESEEEGRQMCRGPALAGSWPCYFFDSDTTGEKPFEEFHLPGESVDYKRFEDIGVVRNRSCGNDTLLWEFKERIGELRSSRRWSKTDLVSEMQRVLPGFDHQEKGKDLDGRM